MKLLCYLVSIKLASLTKHESYPLWVSRHILQCERCRSEAQLHTRLLNELDSPNQENTSSSATWQELSNRLEMVGQDRSPVSQLPKYAFAACVAFIVCFASATMLSNHSVGQMHTAQSSSITKRPVGVIDQHGLNTKPAIHSVRHIQPKAIASTPKRKRNYKRRYVAQRPKTLVQVANTKLKTTKQLDASKSAQIPPEIAYRAGKLVSSGLHVLAKSANPDLIKNISEKVKSFINIFPSDNKGETNEKDNNNNSSDRVDISDAHYSAV